jgi:hypothetical protein
VISTCVRHYLPDLLVESWLVMSAFRCLPVCPEQSRYKILVSISRTLSLQSCVGDKLHTLAEFTVALVHRRRKLTEHLDALVKEAPEDRRTLGSVGMTTSDSRIVLRSDRTGLATDLIVDHPRQPADYIHTNGTVWT